MSKDTDSGFKHKTLLDFLIKKNLFINAVCGGQGLCGKCRVKLKGDVPAPDEKEISLIPNKLLKNGYRLACRIILNKHTKVKIAEKIPSIRKLNSKKLGLALDIGTTVIKGAVVDLNDGRVIRIEKIHNPQQSLGGDVVSRIGYALNGKYRELRRLLFSGITKLQKRLGLLRPELTVVTGNSAMLNFYQGKKIDGLAHYPFQSEIVKGMFLKNSKRIIFGTIGGFVGGDTIAGILASGIFSGQTPALYIDLGTNGEIALIFNKKIHAISTAAGPAFEGVGIKCGSLAISGAIDHIYFENGFRFTTIDNQKPIGICASGMIELLAILLKNRWLKPDGRLLKEIDIEGLKIEQQDIRKLQLAIAAIHTGIQYLLKKSKLTPERIKRTLITGEFGSHLNFKAMKDIGLLPEKLGTIAFENDLPLKGAIMVLQNLDNFKKSEKIRKLSKHFELAIEPDFQERFVSAMKLASWN